MPRPKQDIAGDINKLVPQAKQAGQTLQPREARAPIGSRKGRGTNSQTESSGAVEATNVQGVLTSSDGMFVVVYDYHVHE